MRSMHEPDAGRRRPLVRKAPRQVLLRGLAVLEALNRRPVSTLEQLADATRLPKSTVVRMLDLMVVEGYVQRLPKRRGYLLDERVLTLSAGFRSHDAIAGAAKPFLSAFTATHNWPLALATLDVDAMRVRASTVQESPFATEIDRRRLGRRVPILASALGRAHLAFCRDEERATLLTLLKASTRKHDLPARDDRYVSSLIRQIHRVGYAVSAPQPDDPASGIALPILGGGRVLASISLRYLGKAMSEAEAARRYLKALRTTAEAIAASIRS